MKKPNNRRHRGNSNSNPQAPAVVEKNENRVSGVIIEALPNTEFKVQIPDQEVPIHAYLAGKMKINRIRVLVGDKVEIELNPYEGKSRLVKRL